MQYSAYLPKLFFPALLLLLFSGCDKTRTDAITYRPAGSVQTTDYYIVGIHPYLNSKKTFTVYEPVFNYLEKHLGGVKFQIETSHDYAQYDDKLYRGVFDFALPNPFQTVNSFKHNYRAIAKMKPDDVFRGIFVARKATRLKAFGQLKGEAVSFPAPTALAATIMPKYYLWKNGIDVNRDIVVKYVGSQFSSIMNAYSGDVIAAATWPPPWEQWKKENPDKAGAMEVVWQTEPLVNNGFVVRTDIDPALAAKVATLLISLDSTEAGKALLEHAGFMGFETADNRTFDPVIAFLKAYDTAIGLPE